MENLTIIRQLDIGFGLVFLFLVGTIVFFISLQNQLADLTENQYQHPFTVSNAVARADANIATIRRMVSDVVVLSSDVDAQKYDVEIAAKCAGNMAEPAQLLGALRAMQSSLIRVVHQVRLGSDSVASNEQATQQNAALVEQMAAASTRLRAQASDLVQLVALFKLAGQTTSQRAAPAVAQAWEAF